MSGRKTILALTAGALWASAALFAAGQPSNSQPLGYVTSQGDVRVDRQEVPSGTAVFTGDVITTGRSSVASVKLVSGAQATLGENGEMTVATGDSSSPIRLTRGAIALWNSGIEPAHVGVGASTVVVKGEQGFPAICRVAYLGSATSVFADRGRVEVRRKGFSRLVLPGKAYRLEAGMPQAAGQPAGKVTNTIPQGTVQHPGQTAQINLNLNDSVLWEDVVRTPGTGRIRIALLDGSVLNVGARSTMRIVKHDAQSQQTEIEMQLGKLRGQVVKMSKPGASFQIKTQTAVIGVVGTLFTITPTPGNTHVVCAEGRLNVRNIDPNVPGERTLGPGEQTNVPAGQPPSAPVPAGAAQVADELNLTNAGEVPTPDLGKFGEFKFPGGATPPPGTPPTVPPAAPAALQVGSTVASGVSAGLAGVAISKAGDAKTNAEAATGAADAAADAADAASNAATDSANAANAFTQGVQNFIDSISPGGGGCGCIP
ncbi:MAG: FecR domain-containing protein [Acidobacteria bacterium]|nr:FecR domain-containing protein [Acidobacteriota bacterium]